MIDPTEITATRRALGQRLANYRKAAGLNQHQLAPHTHYGRSTIANVETGRQNVPRDFWERCERALNADGQLLAAADHLQALVCRQREETARLAEVEQATSSSQPAGVRPDPHFLPEVVGRLSSAMLSPSQRLTADAVPTISDLATRVTMAWELRQRASYAALGGHLAVLIPEIEASAASVGSDDHEAVLRLAVHTYNAASSLLKRLGDCELALLAADRAVRTATALDDPVLSAAASYRLANVMLCAARFDATRDVALHAADSIEPGKAQAPLSLASWGGLLLTAAVATARSGDEPGAWELIGEARTASRMLGVEYADIHTIFGPTNVALHSVQVVVELGNGQDAVARAERVDVDRLPASLVERRGQFLIDMAHGYSLTGDDGEATFALMRAEQTAPEEVRFNPAAHQLVHTLLGRERRSATPGLRELAGRLGAAE
ncbi:MAG TPA: helix-turn-helix transcriptional regulator [Mycobacteriales bacterium]|nr:helix-turn-helix transcriptional regulator [Mycobacteriales bacterium]